MRIPLSLQYLSFYIIILIIPVFFLGYIIHFYLLANLKGQVMASNEQKLVQMKEMVDTKLSEFHKISMQVSTQHELTPYYVDNFFDVFKAKRILNYKVGNEFIYELFYHIRGNDYLFSGDSSYSIDSFIRSYYQFQNWTPEQFYQDINESAQPFLRNSEEVKIFNGEPAGIITYGVPVPFNSKNPYGTIIFLIKEQMIQDMLKNVVNSDEGNAFIIDENNQIVAALHDKSKIKEVTGKIKESQSIGVQSLKIEKQTYYISHVESNFLDWSYFTLTPETELMKDVNSIRDKVLLSYVAILLAGILIIYFGMRINYQPLQKLIRRTEEKWARVVGNHHGLDKIWGAIDYSEQTNQLLSKRVEHNRPVLQQHLLIRLLRGEIASYEEFNILGKDIDIQLNQSSYYVMLIEFYDKDFVNRKMSKLVNDWLSKLESLEKYQIELFETSKIVFIVSGDADRLLLHEWYQTFIKSRSYSVTLGIGNSYYDATQIGKSHLEASTALNYKLIKGTNQIIFFEETSADNSNNQWYDKEIVDRLELYLRQRDKEQVTKIMGQVIEIIKSPSANLFFAKCLMFDVSSTVMRIVHDLEQVHQELEEIMPDVLQINDFHSIEEMEETVTQMIQTVFKFYDQSDTEHQLLDDLLSYLRENYHDYQISIQVLAEHFSLSEAYIMRYFKKQTGETILQHLNRLRMEHTKHLLKTSDLQIKEIALQVGYSDVSSFIRKFKQQEKLTPGEYRKKYTNKNAI